MNALPTLDFTDWTVLDFEMALDGLTAMGKAGTGITNQPRRAISGPHNRGCDFIDDLVNEWIDWRIDELSDRLKVIRFEHQEDDDRRIRLLLKYWLDDPGLSVPELVQLALEQSVRSAP